MGLDVRITVQSEGGEVCDESGPYALCWEDIDWSMNGGGGNGMYSHEISGGFELNFLERYYGPGYERGNWPEIFGVITALRKMFPHAVVRYGSDTQWWDELTIVTDKFLDEIWAHYVGPDGHAYRRS